MFGKKLAIVMVGLLIAASLAACGEGIQAGPAGVTGDLNLTLTTRPSPPVRNESATVVVQVSDKDGKPVEGATVMLSSGMVGMSHGGPKGQLADKGGGAYEGTGKFSMGGTWRIQIEASKGGGTPTTGRFDIEVKQ
jgi:nitrogen fixation protein FixH